MKDQIFEAIENQNLLEFNYEGYSRTVEPHCYGLTTKGNEAIRAYQVDGYSSSGKMGWKLYDLSKADNLEILDDIFETRDDYKRGDKGMSKIFIEI
ncbi:WYL domain-containing protein [Dysgonomonas sp. HDW5A]|uniref:WYL domain-containing protein n=1 Tax=Dysgonomonas sp. HDW5A TaxID=2714926 RepID=UPI00140B2678|nr:WYL domain-containing protein [Dysgonomonas sp. HDW5A]QIK59888.1 WYL domain-containing protein [Dysgonomonas sp. HDW5A]